MHLNDIKTLYQRLVDDGCDPDSSPLPVVIGHLSNEVHQLRALANYLQGYKDAAPDIHNHSHFTYAMKIPKGYAFNQIGDVVAIAPFDPAFGAHESSPVKGELAIDERHQDDRFVDAFAYVMKWRMEECSEKGKSGWDDPDACTPDYLAALLMAAVKEGNPIDIANYCMMIYSRAELGNFSAQQLIHDHSSMNVAAEAQQKINSDTLMKVQSILGMSTTVWADPNSVAEAVSDLKFKANVNMSEGTPLRQARDIAVANIISQIDPNPNKAKVNAELDAISMSVGLPVNLPYDFKRKIPFTLGKDTPISLTDSKMWADIEGAIAKAVKEQTEHLSDLWSRWPGDEKVVAAMFDRFAEATEYLGLRGAYLKDIDTQVLWPELKKEMAEGLYEILQKTGIWAAHEWPRWPGVDFICQSTINNIKDLDKTDQANIPPHHPV